MKKIISTVIICGILIITIFCIKLSFHKELNFKDEGNGYNLNCHDNQCDLQLIGDIYNMASYSKLTVLLHQIPNNTNLNIYLAGPGGEIEGLIYLLENIKLLKLNINTYIVNDVSSADAILAISLPNPHIPDHIMIMFHDTSVKNEVENICNRTKSLTDRGMPLYDKCVNYLNKHIQIMEALLIEKLGNKIPKTDLDRILKGDDVHYSGKEIKEMFGLK